MDFRERVEYLLQSSRLLKKDLAKHIGISQGNLNRTLMGTSYENEVKIADFFGLTHNELMNTPILQNESNDDSLLSIIASQQETIKILSRTIENLTSK